MPFDPFQVLVKIERKSPKLARIAAMCFLSGMSPFNSHLGSKMLEWSDDTCVIEVKKRRSVRNHVNAIHAGALFTLGETCAGLIIVRNFPFAKYRPLMSEVKASFSKQARGDVVGKAYIAPETITRMKADVERGEIPFAEVVTEIRNSDGEIACTVTTTWQVKQWGLVKTKLN